MYLLLIVFKEYFSISPMCLNCFELRRNKITIIITTEANNYGSRGIILLQFLQKQ
jgi:hypothetical protein